MKDYSVLDNMIRMVGDTIKQAFDKGYKQGYEDGRNTAQFCFNNEGYEEGLKDAWEAAKWIFNASVDDMMQTFGGVSLWVHYTASEAISRIKEYEEKQKAVDKIQVGDEIKIGDDNEEKGYFRAVVTDIDADKALWVIDEFGANIIIESNRAKEKTGRHFSQIEEVLKQMQEDKE